MKIYSNRRLTEKELLSLWNLIEKDLINKDEEVIVMDSCVSECQTEEECAIDDVIDNTIDEMFPVDEDGDSELLDQLSMIEDQFVDTNRVFLSEEEEQKYLVINDAHIPFHKKRMLDAIISRYANRGYHLVLVGDMLDCHDISSFPKAYHVGLDKEVKLFKRYLRDWSSKFGKIYLVSGNHEKRMATYLRKRLSPDVVQFMPDDIIENIVKDLNIENIHYTSGEAFSWYIQIDNVILAHPKTFVASVLGTCTKVMEYFKARGSSADVFITAHTHKMGMAMQNGCTLIESGCMCLPQDYALEGQVTYKPQSTGYVTFTSKNNKVSFNDIRLVYLG